MKNNTNTSRHTPGPWMIGKSERVIAGVIEIEQHHSIGLTYEERIANARLIAAAPELLEALHNLYYMTLNHPAIYSGATEITKAGVILKKLEA